MKLTSFLSISTCLLFFSSCAVQKQHEIAEAKLFQTADNNKSIGLAKFYDKGNGRMELDLTIDYPQRADSVVAVHFHDKGDCGGMGNMAMGHWNPTNEKHGKWGSATFHSGDIGNIQLDHKGHGVIKVVTDRWSTVPSDIKNIVGKAIIVHGGKDDYTTQPTGNSGPRVGCGVIEKV